MDRNDCHAAEFQVVPPGPNRAPEFIAHQIADLARWARGEFETYRGDADVAIETQEILMGIYESARTHTLVHMPLRTKGRHCPVWSRMVICR